MWFTIGFAAACAVGAWLIVDHYCLLAVGAGALWVAAYFLQRNWKRFRFAAAVILGICVGLLWFACFDLLYMKDAELLNGKTLTITAEAADYSVTSDYGSSVKTKMRVEHKEYTVLLYINEGIEISPGDTITGPFRLRYTNDTQDPHYQRGNGVLLVADPQSEVQVVPADSVPPRYYPAVIRKMLMDALNDAFPSDTAFFARALLLGDRTGIDYETDTALSVSGISHVISVSGLHVTILFFPLIFLFGGNRWLTALFGIPVLLLFAAVVGFSPSITRACLMQFLMILASLFDREYDQSTSLSFAVLAMLFVNPLTITSVGFQLSVGCMAGIYLFFEKINNWIIGFPFWERWKGRTVPGRLRNWFAGSVAITFSAMFFTTPLVAFYFGSVSLISMVTNLLTLWAISIVFYGVLAVCILSLFCSSAASVLAWLISWCIRFVLWVVKGLASLPLAAVYTKSVYIIAWIVVSYLLIFGFLLFKKRQPYVLICCVILCLCVSLFLSWMEPLLDDTRMTVLDVGQGQCVLLQSKGKSYLIDCGGEGDTQSADLAAETLLSMGISRLDGVIVTHYDRDHAGGVQYLLSRIPADGIYLPHPVEDDPLSEAIMTRCHDVVIYVENDLRLSWGQTSITIFAPILSDSSNESGLIVLFQSENCDILITGDLSTLGESILLREKTIPELTALVAGHHGSQSSTGEELLAATTPEYVFISVGAENGYGHPSKDVLVRLEKYNCTVYRTDQCGTITFRR